VFEEPFSHARNLVPPYEQHVDKRLLVTGKKCIQRIHNPV